MVVAKVVDGDALVPEDRHDFEQSRPCGGSQFWRGRGTTVPGPGSDDLSLSLWFQDVNENLVRTKHIGVGVVVAACKH